MKKLLLISLFVVGFVFFAAAAVKAATADKWWLVFICACTALYFVVESKSLLYYLGILTVQGNMCRWCNRPHNTFIRGKKNAKSV